MSSNDTMEDLINFSVHNDSATGRYVERVRKDHFLLSRANQLMGCLINKVASSSMMRMYLTLQGIDQKKIESPHGFRTKFVPEVIFRNISDLFRNVRPCVLLTNKQPYFGRQNL